MIDAENISSSRRRTFQMNQHDLGAIDLSAAKIELSVQIACAHVSNNSVPANEVPDLISTIHAALVALDRTKVVEVKEEPPKPAVPIKNSITDEAIICLEDGKKFKAMKRHLASAFGMSPTEYRQKWGLPSDYPMVAPAYAAGRSALAKKIGLGLHRPSTEGRADLVDATAKSAKRRRSKKSVA